MVFSFGHFRPRPAGYVCFEGLTWRLRGSPSSENDETRVPSYLRAWSVFREQNFADRVLCLVRARVLLSREPARWVAQHEACLAEVKHTVLGVLGLVARGRCSGRCELRHRKQVLARIAFFFFYTKYMLSCRFLCSVLLLACLRARVRPVLRSPLSPPMLSPMTRKRIRPRDKTNEALPWRERGGGGIA